MILAREVRDQLRDRRTLFMIAVLPILLYPLLGMSLLQVSQFVQEQPTRVLVVGAAELPGLPPLVEDDRFAGRLVRRPASQPSLLNVTTCQLRVRRGRQTDAAARAESREEMVGGNTTRSSSSRPISPPDFDAVARVDGSRSQRRSTDAGSRRRHDREAPVEVAQTREMYPNTANDKSQVALPPAVRRARPLA